MNVADLPAGYANIQLRDVTDLKHPIVLGNFHSRQIAEECLTSSRFYSPANKFDLFTTGPKTAIKPSRKPKLRVLRRAA